MQRLREGFICGLGIRSSLISQRSPPEFEKENAPPIILLPLVMVSVEAIDGRATTKSYTTTIAFKRSRMAPPFGGLSKFHPDSGVRTTGCPLTEKVDAYSASTSHTCQQA